MPRDEVKWESSCYKSPRYNKISFLDKFFTFLVYMMIFLLSIVFLVLGIDLFLYFTK
jgi:hypothetical protein